MDRKLLEFWGTFLLNSAKTQEQAERLNDWARDGFKFFEEQLKLFQSFYGVPPKKPEEKTATEDPLSQATANVMKSWQDFMGLLGVVPKPEYDALAEKCRQLEERIGRLEADAGLRKTPADPSDISRGFEALMDKQVEQFQTLMNAYGNLYATDKRHRKTSKPRSPSKE